jgi:photosystem II stability/assembly factor-like uncharacterized protein
MHANAVAPPVEDPVAAVHLGMRRRQRVRRVQAAAAALAVVAVAAGVTTLVGDPWSSTRVTPVPGASLTTVPTPQATTEPTTGPTAGSNVPASSQGADLSWVSVSDGFALTTATCGSGRCSHLLSTTDGGRTWTDVGASGLPDACSTSCPLRVRFADRLVGYVYGDGLVMTTDGGRTWTRQPGPDTHGLEIAGGTALRVVELTGCPGCRFAVQRSDAGSSTWTTVRTSDELRSAAELARQGDDVAVALKANPAGGAGDAHTSLLLSRDGGTTWTVRDDPCGGGPSNDPDEVDAVQVSWSLDHQLVVLCQRRMYRSNGGNSTVTVSADGGRTFSRPTGFPEATDAHLVAAGIGVLLAQTRQGIDQHVALQRSTDGGTTWTEVARASLTQGEEQGYLAFSTEQVATWAPPGARAVWRTTDGGATWTEHAFAG